ncbi:unnamed protein product [Arabidopsis thaliana]|uniref:(thale cress) hypothetical protein n=1 Tax=Arabidopsis thaliana TaxID=3702 RepID=A0A7G2FE23_ARATH|nr:unnamed protein product [Arabidopsis thaliana]
MEVDDIVVVQVGGWILYSTGEWEFKLDSCGHGRAMSLMGLITLRDLELKPGPTMIGSDWQFRCFKSLSIGDKSVNLFVCFREGDSVIVGPACEPGQTSASVVKYFEAGEPTFAGIVQSIDKPVPAVGGGYFAGLLSTVQDNMDAQPPNNHSAFVQSTAKSGAFVTAARVDTSLPAEVPDSGDDSGDDSESLAESDESSSLSTGSDSEVSEFDDDTLHENILQSDKEIVVHKDIGDDDFVEQPPKKKVWLQNTNPGAMTDLLETCQKGISIDQVYGYENLEPMFGNDDIEAKAAYVDLTKEDDNMFVGRTFASREDFRIALSIYAINRIFRFKFTRYEKHYLVAECYDKKNCDWRVRAHQVGGDSEEYEVRLAKLEHVCKVQTRSRFSKHATSKVVAALLRAKYAKAFCGPRARDLPDSILRDHNVRMTYWKCWKAKELAVETAQGTDESSFSLLPTGINQYSNPSVLCSLKHTMELVWSTSEGISKEARGSPVVALLEFIRKMLARWFESRRKKIPRTVGDIPIAVERELMKRFKGALGMSVSAVGSWDFKVVAKDGEQFHISLGLEFRTLVGEMHRLTMWSPTVQAPILPVRNPSEVEVPQEIRSLCLMPPQTKRPAGRPPKLRIHSVGEYERCLKAGNKTAIYYEGLRVVAEGCDLNGGLELLAQLVPEDGASTIACGIFSMCLGNEAMAVHYLEQFGIFHAPLGTQRVRLWGEELVRDLRPYRRISQASYRKAFIYPLCKGISSPDCAMDCALASSGYENFCNDCYLWWLSGKVCQMV